MKKPGAFGAWIGKYSITILSCLFLLLAPEAKTTPDSSFIIENMIVSGNRITKKTIIFRELDLHPGDTLNFADTTQVFLQNSNRVFNTGLFIWVKIFSMPSANNILAKREVHIVVKERWYTYPNPIFELADRNFNEWWHERNRDLRRTNIGMRFVQKNCRGRNEQLKIALQAGFTPKYELFYTFPYIEKTMRTGLRLGVSYSTNRSVAYETAGNVLQFYNQTDQIARTRFYTSAAISHRNRFFQSHDWEIGFARNTVSDTIAQLNPEYFLDARSSQRFFSFRYFFNYDRRNIVAYPLEGFLIQASAVKIGILPQDQVNMSSISVALARYIKLAPSWFYATRTEAEAVFGARQPYSNMRALGYSRVVRGYERNVIEGRTLGIWANSVRYLLLGKTFHTNKSLIPHQFKTVPVAIYLKTYGDLGYAANPYPVAENARLTNTILAGTGLGIDIVTFYDLVWRLEYSINRHNQQGLYISFKADI